MKWIKRQLGIRYVIMRASLPGVLTYPDGAVVFEDRQEAHKYAKMYCGTVMTYRKAMKFSKKWGRNYLKSNFERSVKEDMDMASSREDKS